MLSKFKTTRLTCLALCFICACTPTDQRQAESDRASSHNSGPNISSNQRMAVELAKIAEECDPEVAWHINEKLANIYKERMEQAQGQQKIGMRFKYAQQLLNAGKTTESIHQFNTVIEEFAQLGAGLNSQTKLAYEMLAIAFMRLGEEENCCAMHNAESCFLPIRGKGIHTKRTGSESAIHIYEKILELQPLDLQSKYLLNLAYMTLGEYPDKVPPQFLIPNFGQEQNIEVPYFRDVAIDSKTDIYGLSGGCCVDDFNNDGYLDIIATSYGLTDQMKYLINNGDGTFKDHTEQAGLNGLVSGLNTKQADFNNDGYLDVLVLRGAWLGAAGRHPNSLLRNNGDDTFTDVTRQAGLYSLHPTQTAVWRDFNNDGWIDVFIGNEANKGRIDKCELYINNQDETFSEVALVSGIDINQYVKGVIADDINNDGWQDIFISCINAPNLLYLNNGVQANGTLKFTDISTSAGIQRPTFSFPCWFWDYDQDGKRDLFVSSYDLKGFENMSGQVAAELTGGTVTSELPRIYRNKGNNAFEEVSASLGVDKLMFAMGSNFGDINSDGYPDFYIGNGAPDFRMIIPNRMFLNQQGRSFVEVTYDGGFGHIQKGHAVGFGDIDNDGDEDIYCVMGGAVEGDKYQNLLFSNPGNNNNWITLKLEGVQSNRAAIGAKVAIHGVDDQGSKRIFYHTVSTGGSFGGSSLQIEAGLGKISTIERVEVSWPNRDRTQQTFTNIAINSAYLLKENASGPARINLETFAL